MAKGSSGHFHGTKGELISEVKAKGYKISGEKVLAIGKDKDGKIVWLEEGRLEPKPSGYAHILDKHDNQFNENGISNQNIPQFIVLAATEGKIVGFVGDRKVYEYNSLNQTYHVAITISDNGYIVGANLVSKWKDKSR